MKNIFNVFDAQIGVDGYYQILRDKLFPNSKPDSIDIATFPLECQTFRKGSLFSRVRSINNKNIQEFFETNITKDDFYPPKNHKISIPQGRFNAPNTRTLYLADHPFVAMKECCIEANQYFLLSYIKLSVDMHLLYVEKDKNEISDMIYHLLHSQDSNFYPVINKINDDILKFKEFQGMVYDSVKIKAGYEDQVWGVIPTSKNLAISGECIKDTELSLAWLCSCDEKLSIYHHSLFKPLSNKKKNKLMRINYKDDKARFICEHTKAMKKLDDDSKKTKRLLEKGYYSDFKQPPFKVLWK